MSKSTDQLRRDAKTLRRAYETGDSEARALVASVSPRPSGVELKHADFLHVIARAEGFASWPALTAAAELHGLDRAQRIARLMAAMIKGQDHIVGLLMSEDPDLEIATLSLAAGFYRADAVAAFLKKPQPETPSTVPAFIRFCQSRMLRLYPEREAAMLEIANAFLARGTNLDAGIPAHEGSDHPLSPLYFALGHAGNLPLARWLLEQGANPNDNESLYHSTELGHLEGLRLLLAHGAVASGTNALPRAIDFDDAGMVRLLLEAGADPNEFSPGEVGGEAPFVVPALHQAARRMSSPEVVDLLMDAGADPAVMWRGLSVYAYARVYGNAALARRIEAMGASTKLSDAQALMADAADGADTTGRFVDPAELPDEFRGILRNLVHLPGKLAHMERLVQIGVEYDRPDPMEALTPVQVAGWEGLPEVLGFFLSLKPDLSHVNGYGGTLLSTIIHGSENNPSRAGRDYAGCLELALSEGVALPRRAIELAGEPDIAAFLADWAEAHPGQVVEHGIG